ncbi:type II toxin-antitoxin system Phd/YefM family antitoxin [Sphingomonas sp. PB4P5]|uniref:type II toxin-antitoxin system Phd/YefM family antitoxin n=1 Tax=Parasphingomonas puruogangriensis TaxID=3096155 RepID=UPI002FC7BA6E
MNDQSKIVGVREVSADFGAYLARVAAGECFDIVSDGQTVAVLRAPVAAEEDWVPSADPASPNFRRPGALKGKMWISDDFNDPDPELEAAMEADIFPPER